MSVTETLKAHSPIEIDEQAKKKLAVIASRLQAENKKYNLTALTSDEDIALLHFVDCLQLLKHISFKGKSVIDVGCGAGFPSLVIAAAEESAMVTGLDSTAKKLSFVAETAKLAGIKNLNVICGRAEEKAFQHRESFDIAVSRGVTKLNALCELCLPFVKVGGLFVAMKGITGHAEAEDAKNAINTLCGEIEEIIPAPVPQKGDEHCLVVIRKKSNCSAKYPRPWAKIKSNAL